MTDTPTPTDTETPLAAASQLVAGLRAQGILDARVLDAMEATPRNLFVPSLFQDRSWEDSALPIACGQTISQPYIVARMTEALRLEARHRVLEIGTGSGYQTAVLSRLVRYVYSVERYRSLMTEAEARFRTLGLENIITKFADGGAGWPEQAPFDRIMATAAAQDVPKALLMQLKPGGILLAPVGRGAVQRLMRYTATEDGAFLADDLGEVRFVPLLDGVAREV